ncbi:MAG: pantoate--beta-alanine ligase [Bacteroidia bacterium]|nr:pantoate--beta-alanine ligase [Bacteroidia bacterium]
MQIFHTIKEVKLYVDEKKQLGHKIGFVPTMGALHQGHISLIETSKKQTDITICSIFVNPTQFNNADDLKHYPRTPDNDIQMLQNAKCDVLYMPEVNDIYPNNEILNFDFGIIGNILEGEHRPGHFNGVGQVVSILLKGIQPHKAFFGSKDYQPVMIVKELIKQQNIPVEIFSCPILREADGLAMSSRNKRLTNEERKVASLIPIMMKKAADLVREKGVTYAKLYIDEQIQQQPLMKLDYYEICDTESLNTLHDIYNKQAISLIAVFVGAVRLIDNLEI